MCKGACVCICHVCGNQKPLLGALLEMLPLSFEAESLSGTGWMTVPGWLVKELLGCPRLCRHKCTLPSLPLFLLFCDMGSEGQIWVLCFYGRHFINGAVSPARFLFKFRHSSGFYGDNVISKGDNSYLFLSVYLPFGPILPLVALIEMPVPCWMWVVRADIYWCKGKLFIVSPESITLGARFYKPLLPNQGPSPLFTHTYVCAQLY